MSLGLIENEHSFLLVHIKWLLAYLSYYNIRDTVQHGETNRRRCDNQYSYRNVVTLSGVNRFESQPTVTCDGAVVLNFCQLSEDNIQASSDLLATTMHSTPNIA